MIEILILLLSGKTITASKIADRYEISVRSVYRYVDDLSLCGIPVYVTRGRYGGIKIADTYRLPSGFFTNGEYTATINALTAMLSQVSDKNLSTALEKLQIQQKSEKRELAVCGNIIVDGGTYISRDGEHSKRVVDPHTLIYKQGIWYVYAFCHTKQTFRTFKIGRIKSASFTGETFVKKAVSREETDLSFNYPAEKLVDVTFGIEKSSLADAEDWLGIDNIEPRGEGFIASLSLPDDEGLVNKILSYGGKVKVLEPQNLKERVIETARKIANQ